MRSRNKKNREVGQNTDGGSCLFIMMSFNIVLIALCINVAFGNFANQFHQDFNLSCPSGKAVSFMLSINDCQKTDRMWNIHCYAGLPTYGASYSISYWSSFFANDFFGKMKFQCGPNAVISGMGSVFSRIDKDRRYRFRCTHMRYYSKSACKWSDWLNDYNAPMSHHVPRNSYINGMESVQDPINRDRRFKLEICQLSRW